MYHMAAFTVLIGQTADTDVPAVVDDILTIQNSHFVLRQPTQLLLAAVMSVTLSRAKIASPSMRQLASPFIRPVILAVTPPSNPNLWLLDHNPFVIPAFEEVQLQATSALGAGTERLTGLIVLAPQIMPCPVGNQVPLRITSTTAAVANAWTTLTLTFADTLPSGIYAACLSEHSSTTGIAHRWIFSGQEERPGLPSYVLKTDRHPYAISKGQLGVMGRFRSNDLPRLQVLCNAADASHEVYLHVIRVGNLV